ncbi:MAG: hypothetical protein NTV86_04125 [Planctomycetota bacterium]|nr:hypothetical protein [Planctomycetota bacterium]
MMGKTGLAGLVMAMATAGAMGQASQPASVAKDLPDAWLGEWALKKLAQAAQTGQYKPLQDQLTAAILGRLAAAGTANLDALNDAVYVVNACEFLPATEGLSNGRSFAQWLLANRPVSRLLFRTMACERPKADGIKGLHALWQAEPKLVAEYANLAVAFATASPEPAPGELVKPATPVEAFTWYLKKSRPSRYDLRAMPFELSRYLACTTLSLSERTWAQANYPQETNSDRLYNALKYDMDFVNGSPKKISALAFTLPNLLKVGGVCLERAYFSAEVYRAMGVPAVMVVGSGTRGGHAWLGYLRKTPDGKSVTWDTATGRYAGDRYFVGELFDPVSGQGTNDCELSVSLAAMLLPLRQREHATTAVQLARLVDGFAGPSGAADAPAGALARLAGEYNALPAAGATTLPASLVRNGPAVDLPPLAPARRLDAAVTESLLTQALGDNMALNIAWDLAIHLGEKNRLSVDRVGRLVDILLQRTAAEYPDYGCSRALRLVETISDQARKAGLYERAAQIFSRRPDLAGRCFIAAGHAWLAADKERLAMASYEHAVQATRNNAPGVLMEAMDAMEKVLRKNNKLKTAIELYNHYYEASHPMDMKSPFRTSSERYRLGSRLVELLQEASLDAAAKKISLQLDPPAKDASAKKP